MKRILFAAVSTLIVLGSASQALAWDHWSHVRPIRHYGPVYYGPRFRPIVERPYYFPREAPYVYYGRPRVSVYLGGY